MIDNFILKKLKAAWSGRSHIFFLAGMCLLAVQAFFFCNPSESHAFRAEIMGKRLDVASKKMPKEVDQALSYLVSMTDNKDIAFSEEKAAPLMNFITTKKLEANEYYPKSMDNAKGVCMVDELKCSLYKVLRYGYSPDIPSYLITPSIIRVSGWYPGNKDAQTPLWESLDHITAPIVIRGVEYEEITPESSSGGYYKYDLNRVLILFKYQDKKVLLSVAKQKGPSSVGKKGVILEEDNWDYFYSGLDGLTTGGLSWMDTYMYDSFSVCMFMENPTSPPTTDYVVIKWLRAGWASLNVVKPKHIFNGCRRTATAFKAIMESSRLPEPQVLAEKFSDFSKLSDQELDKLLTPYLARLKKLSKKHPVLSDDDFKELVENDEYIRNMTREERISILMKDFLRRNMGKSPLITSSLN